MLSRPRVRVQSLVGELRSHTTPGGAKKKKKKKNWLCYLGKGVFSVKGPDKKDGHSPHPPLGLPVWEEEMGCYKYGFL